MWEEKEKKNGVGSFLGVPEKGVTDGTADGSIEQSRIAMRRGGNGSAGSALRTGEERGRSICT